jgi:murein DD-endopeptidase MepM/ murein hydrolase activator NlpD
MGLAAASCSNSERFADSFGADATARADLTGSIPETIPPSNHVDSGALPQLTGGDGQARSGGDRGITSYQPATAESAGSTPPTAAPPARSAWSWNGGTPVTLASGETLATLSRRYGVPVAVIMQANHITAPTTVHAGQHLVIPRYPRSETAAAPPATHVASIAPSESAASSVASRGTAPAQSAGAHVVAPGETLRSIARSNGESVQVLAKANNISPDTMVRVGQRIVVPTMRAPARAADASRPSAAPTPAPHGSDLATTAAPTGARIAETTASPAPQDSAVKTAEPGGGLPKFRWPVRGRVIAAFGPKPNGLQNDGINVAVPEGTPIKAAEDGVVAYAGNELKGYGNLVLLRHPDGFVTAYAHASEILVTRGEQVKRGQVIAKAGETGNVTSPQLHFEIRKGATPVDPAQYLNGA